MTSACRPGACARPDLGRRRLTKAALWLRRAVVVGLVVAVGWGIGGLLRPPEPGRLPRILPLRLEGGEFGAVLALDGGRHPVQIVNSGDTAIRIERFAPSCVCTAIEPASVVVPPRGSAAITAIFEFAQYQQAAAVEGPLPTTIELIPVVEGKRRQTEGMALKGEVAPCTLSAKAHCGFLTK